MNNSSYSYDYSQMSPQMPPGASQRMSAAGSRDSETDESHTGKIILIIFIILIIAALVALVIWWATKKKSCKTASDCNNSGEYCKRDEVTDSSGTCTKFPSCTGGPEARGNCPSGQLCSSTNSCYIP